MVGKQASFFRPCLPTPAHIITAACRIPGQPFKLTRTITIITIIAITSCDSFRDRSRSYRNSLRTVDIKPRIVEVESWFSD
ncbi:hypothetical protein KC19_2G256800 [Ceratodon purpureus]|uniref:Uncharacterized protein n=1 Tax=Ceratodon purpureus TaxID=3225 RepID=A0A8T0J1P9_CERPU|nr:hypothetical protein KC19_2G256800 [Ceratodon purpureus]